MRCISVTKLNILHWKSNPKYAVAVLYLGLYMWDSLNGMVRYAQDLGCPIAPWVFPFLPSGAPVITAIMLAFVLLISDAPFRNRQQQFILLRTGKQVWLGGQLVYIFFISVVFTVLVWLLSWVFLLPELEWGLEWGAAITTGAVTKAYGGYSNIAMEYTCMKGIAPFEATMWVAAVMITVCYLLGVIMVACNLWFKKGIGTVVVSGLIILPMLISTFAHQQTWIKHLLWISPVSWMDRSLMGHSNQILPSYAYAVMMPAALAIILTVTVMGTIHKCDLETTKE